MLPDFYDPDAVIETERLMLRPLEERDALSVYREINHDPEVLRYYLAPYIEREEDASVSGMIASCRAQKMYIFAVVNKESGQLIGMLNQCSAPNMYFRSLELGYAFGCAHWNQGYATEALRAAIDFMFLRGIHKLTCCHIVENAASGRVMQKAGMIYEGIRPSEIYYHGKYWDTANYYILNPDDEV